MSTKVSYSCIAFAVAAFMSFSFHSASAIEGQNSGSGSLKIKNLKLESQTLTSKEQVKTLWNGHFASSEIIFPDPYKNLLQLLKVEPTCLKPSLELLNILNEYEVLALRSQNQKIEKHQKKIRDLLFQAEKGTCFQALSKVLAAKSLTLLAFDNRFISCKSKPSESADLKCYIPYSQNSVRLNLPSFLNQQDSQVALIADRWILNLIAISLLNNNSVHFLPLEQSREYFFSGSFQCLGSSQITLNPYLPIYDLAATFAHELQHVFRDKFSVNTKLDPKSFLIVDEAFASIYGGFLQRELNSFFPQKEPLAKAVHVFSRLVTLRAPDLDYWLDNFNLNKDLSFFNPLGPLNTIWLNLGSGTAVGSLSSWNEFINVAFLRESKQENIKYTITDHGRKYIDPSVQKIYSIVKKAYFNEELSGSEIASLKPENLNFELDPLAQSFEQVVIPVRNSLSNEELSEPYFIGSFKDKDSQDRSLYFRVDLLLESLEKLKQSMSKTSPSCLEFHQLARENTFSNYIGIQKSINPVKPEESTIGGKPGIPVRTCIPWQRDF